MIEVPFVDLKAQHRALKTSIMALCDEIFTSAGFIGGEHVDAFEQEFADFCEAKHCVGVNSGTDALRFALLAAGIGPNHEVITVPNTFIATTEAISQTGAKPVFVDIDDNTYNMDPKKLSEYLDTLNPEILKRVKAIVPVHLYGQPANMDALTAIANQYDSIVVEDACQAHAAEYHSNKENGWKKAGSMGLAAAFSFYPGKNLGACGEAGALTTNDAEIAKTVRMLRDHGQAKKYYHDMEGYNGRLDAIQAGILRIKLKHLNEWTEKRREHARQYSELLGQLDSITIPPEPSWARAVYHLYVIRTPHRDELQKYLLDKGIATGLHYPLPLHLQKAYSGLGYKKGDFPVCERVAEEILSLPMFPELTSKQIAEVCDTISSFVSNKI